MTDARALSSVHGGRWSVVVATLERLTPADVRSAIAAGATTILLPSANGPEVVDALAAGFDGRSSLPTVALRDLMATRSPTERCPAPQHLDLLRALAHGVPVRLLAERIGRSERDTYRLLARVWKDLGTPNRTAALLAAARNGWFEEGPATG